MAAAVLGVALAAGRARAAVGAGVRRDVEGGVAVEEADRLEPEAGVVDGHDRPALGAGAGGECEGVADDEGGPLHPAVRRGAPGEAGAAPVPGAATTRPAAPRRG